MKNINASRLGFASGITGVILYIGCILIMWIGGQSAITWLFNSIIHGVDVSSVVMMNVPILQSVVGLLITFCLGWMVGYLIGTIYNSGNK